MRTPVAVRRLAWSLVPDRLSLVHVFTVLLAGTLLANVGCKDLTSDPGLPAGTPDPSIYKTASGALGLRNGALLAMDAAISGYLEDSGLLSDELTDRNTHTSAGISLLSAGLVSDPLDERILPEGGTTGGSSYANLQNIRGAANIALQALVMYDTAASARATQRVLRGELYAVTGYVEILLADLFCNGIPLSTLNFQQDFTYASSSTWQQVDQDASAKLDSALQLASENDSVLNLARVLKGRAQLNLGHHAAAADDVALVPDTFQYRLTFNENLSTEPGLFNGQATVSDSEGGRGLSYRSSGDLRTATTVTCTPPDTRCPVDTLTTPTKYSAGGYTTFVVANGIEARLIQAEAQLQPATNPAGPWLATLNTLRTQAGLDPLTDPGATLSGTAVATARIALLFRERAFWLFLTGHRQGDLRRLLRQYGPQYASFQYQQQVYPSGLYTAPGTGRYGDAVNVPIPTAEYANPNYHGCLDRNP